MFPNIPPFLVIVIKKTCPLILLTIFILPVICNSQPDIRFEQMSVSNLRKSAKLARTKKDYFTAIDFYEKLLIRKPTDYKSTFQLAEMYRFTRNYTKAKSAYDKAYELNPDKNLLSLYFVGRMQMTQEEYTKAIENFEIFRKKYKDKNEGFKYRNHAKILIEGCELALLDTSFSQTKTEFLSGGVNMAYNEFNPTPLTTNLLLFSSLRSDTVIHYIDSLHKDTSTFKSGFYLAQKSGGSWRFIGKYDGPFEYNNFDVGNACFSLDSSRIYFTKCKKNWKYEIICNIYYSEKSEGIWGDPVKLSSVINNNKYSSTQPAIGLNPKNGNEILYFSSNNPDGHGGYDLWYSEKIKGEFSEMRNLGGRINTRSDEICPYIDTESSTLYFSSNGHPTYGEMDIFKSFGHKTKWMKNPVNIGKPFNSPADDLYYIEFNQAKEGFFTSNRDGGIALKNPNCCDDIYSFAHDKIVRYIHKSQLISDNDVQIKSGDVSVYLRDSETGDTTYLKSVEIDANGKFNLALDDELHYLLVIESPNHFVQSIEIPRTGKEIKSNETDTIKLTAITDKSFILENIYYDFDEFVLTKKAELAIDSFLLKLLNLNPEIKIEISSHTDSKGSDEYNVRLSQKRAESVVQYLRKKGIAMSRLRAKGYGKTKPIASNKNPDGTDNPIGRQLNRRTEFKVFGFEQKVKYKEIPTSEFAK